MEIKRLISDSQCSFVLIGLCSTWRNSKPNGSRISFIFLFLFFCFESVNNTNEVLIKGSEKIMCKLYKNGEQWRK
jgi:hypothetical protein